VYYGGAGFVALAAIAVGAWLAWSYANSPTLKDVDRWLRRQKYAEAERDARAYLVWHRNDAEGIFALAKALAGRGKVKQCAEALERVPHGSPKRAEALYRAGQAYQQIHRMRDAERAFRACVASDPNGQDYAMSARIELAALFAMQERREAFKAVGWEAYDHLPEAKRLPVLTMLMRLEFEQTKPDINATSLRAAVDADPADSYARAGLAAALDQQRNVAEARSLFAKALEEKPQDPELRERYMDLLRRMGDFDAMKAVLAARPPGTDDRPATQNILGIVAESAGDLEAAEAAFRRAVQLNPRDPEYHHRLSLVLFRRGRSAEAAKEAATRTELREGLTQLRQAWTLYANAFDVDPDQIPTELVLGMARAIESCGRDREAIAWYRQVLRLDARESTARAALDALERRAKR
jgi:tetratricopeptide (TPR) repeat protein